MLLADLHHSAYAPFRSWTQRLSARDKLVASHWSAVAVACSPLFPQRGFLASTGLASLAAAASSRVNLTSGRTRANPTSAAASHPTTAQMRLPWLVAPTRILSPSPVLHSVQPCLRLLARKHKLMPQPSSRLYKTPRVVVTRSLVCMILPVCLR